ncbi:MAG: penicillin-binding protein 2 [bacterium]|nr:penicillin-binding protein 2 [bacterium]
MAAARMMRNGWGAGRAAARPRGGRDPRLVVVAGVFVLLWAVVVVRLWIVQVRDHEWYTGLAAGQHEVFRQLTAERGEIFVHDRQASDGYFPVATNQRTYTVYAVPTEIAQPKRAAGLLAPLLQLDEAAEVALAERLSKPNDPYEPVTRDASAELRDSVLALALPGIHTQPTIARFYPDGTRMAHLTGFVGADEDSRIAGRYGVEGAFEDVLAGTSGFLEGERDAAGRLIVFGKRDGRQAEHGSDVYLTIERELQLEVCRRLEDAVTKHGAASGSIVILHPVTGAVRAMCAVPAFDPNRYGDVEDIGVYQTPAVSDAYEPGSVFKAVTMAAAIEADAVGPNTEFTDTGSVTLNNHTITNSLHKVYGRSTMTDVLRFSINTGTVYAAMQLGRDRFREAIERFGFGARTGIALDAESPGNIANLVQRGDIYLATASFGQGITATQLQLAVAYAAIANGGNLMEPRIVEAVVAPDGTRKTFAPRIVHRAVSQRAAVILQGMLVSVVRDGYAKSAGVRGYLIGGKTGTAQIPYRDRPGYSDDTIHTFVGIGPVDRPTFSMVVRIDRAQRLFADSTAAPLFGDLAAYIVQYDGVPPRVE